jgi:hypothetical protein
MEDIQENIIQEPMQTEQVQSEETPDFIQRGLDKMMPEEMDFNKKIDDILSF